MSQSLHLSHLTPPSSRHVHPSPLLSASLSASHIQRLSAEEQTRLLKIMTSTPVKPASLRLSEYLQSSHRSLKLPTSSPSHSHSSSADIQQFKRTLRHVQRVQQISAQERKVQEDEVDAQRKAQQAKHHQQLQHDSHLLHKITQIIQSDGEEEQKDHNSIGSGNTSQAAVSTAVVVAPVSSPPAPSSLPAPPPISSSFAFSNPGSQHIAQLINEYEQLRNMQLRRLEEEKKRIQQEEEQQKQALYEQYQQQVGQLRTSTELYLSQFHTHIHQQIQQAYELCQRRMQLPATEQQGLAGQQQQIVQAHGGSDAGMQPILSSSSTTAVPSFRSLHLFAPIPSSNRFANLQQLQRSLRVEDFTESKPSLPPAASASSYSSDEDIVHSTSRHREHHVRLKRRGGERKEEKERTVRPTSAASTLPTYSTLFHASDHEADSDEQVQRHTESMRAYRESEREEKKSGERIVSPTPSQRLLAQHRLVSRGLSKRISYKNKEKGERRRKQERVVSWESSSEEELRDKEEQERDKQHARTMKTLVPSKYAVSQTSSGSSHSLRPTANTASQSDRARRRQISKVLFGESDGEEEHFDRKRAGGGGGGENEEKIREVQSSVSRPVNPTWSDKVKRLAFGAIS